MVRLRVAGSRRQRMKGLLGQATHEALLIPNCRSIHTLGMRFAIKAAFLDSEFRVVEVVLLRPNRVALPRLGARHVIECPEPMDIREGETLKLYLGPAAPCGAKPAPIV
ncbi:MAG: DUF192 domain-containing protein [Actinomycetota bacterium]